MKLKNFMKFLIISLAAALTLMACNSESEEADADTETDSSQDQEETDADDEEAESAEGNIPLEEFNGLPQMAEGAYDIDEFPMEKTNFGEPMDGGNLTVAIVSQTAFAGTLNPLFYELAIDDDIMVWFMEPLIETDDTFSYTQDGAATFETHEDDEGQLVYTITIRDEVNWHDGEPVKAEDLEFSYYTLADPEYDGLRYSTTVANVEGIEEYREGEADEISGITVIDEKTIEITLMEPSPFLRIWGRPIPKHIFEDYHVTEMAEAAETRQNPIGYGPYVIDNIVPGESVVLSGNDDYWRGDVSLDQVTLRVIPSSSIMQEIRTGGVDVGGVPTDQYSEHDDMTNVEVLSAPSTVMTLIGFRLGHVDEETGENIPDPDNKMADRSLRQAMWHAIDTQVVADTYYNGLVKRGTTVIPPYHAQYHDETNPGLEYDPDRANELLDEAGYEWLEGETYRTDPDGEELEIIIAGYQGGDAVEPTMEYYLQSWAEVGLNVSLLDGRLQEFNTFYDIMNSSNRDDEFDMYHAQKVVTNNPDPYGHRGRTASLNWTNWQSEESNILLEEGRSSKAFDSEWLIENWNEWQQVWVEEAADFPTVTSISMLAVNNRVHNYSLNPHAAPFRHEIQVTQEEPIIHGQ